MFSDEWLNDECLQPNQLTFSQNGYRRISVLTVLMTEYRHDMHTHVHNIHLHHPKEAKRVCSRQGSDRTEKTSKRENNINEKTDHFRENSKIENFEFSSFRVFEFFEFSRFLGLRVWVWDLGCRVWGNFRYP